MIIACKNRARQMNLTVPRKSIGQTLSEENEWGMSHKTNDEEFYWSELLKVDRLRVCSTLKKVYKFINIFLNLKLQIFNLLINVYVLMFATETERNTFRTNKKYNHFVWKEFQRYIVRTVLWRYCCANTPFFLKLLCTSYECS